jgi:short-subunit dehydrogenase
MVDDNLVSLMLGCRALLPRMIAGGRGSIVILGSLGGLVPMPHVSAYAAVKFGVRGFALSLASELKGSGVGVCLVSCGPVRTRMLLEESAHRGSIGFVNRPLEPEAVADVIVDALERPEGELMVPRLAGRLAAFAGAYNRFFRRLYPIAALIGEASKRRYRRAWSVAAPEPGGRP